MKKIILLIVIASLAKQSIAQKQGQEKIDSLLSVLKIAKSDTAKVNTLNTLAYEFKSNNPDTAIYFANEALALATKRDYKLGIANAHLYMGMPLINLGEYEEALKNINDALILYDQLLTSENTPDKSKILKQKAMSYNSFGAIYYYQGNYTEALKNYFASLNIKGEIGDKEGIANSYNNIGLIYSDQGNYAEALKNYFASLKIREEIRDKKGIAGSYDNIGIIYYSQGNYPQALKNHFASLKIKEEIGDKKGIADSYNNIGNIFDYQGNHPEALKNLFAALKIKVEIGDKKGIASSYNNIGSSYELQGNYPEALKYYFDALKINEEIGNKNWKAINLGNIGNIYARQANYLEALKNYFASLKIKEEIGNKEGIANSYNNIGTIYKNQGNYPEALKNFFVSLKIKEEIGDKKGMASSYINIGSIYKEQGNYPEALKNHFASLKIYKEIGDKKGIANSYNNIGSTYTKQKKNNEASLNLNKGLSLAKEIGSMDDIKESYNNLTLLDSAQGNFKQAFEHHKMYIIYRDSLFNEEKTKKLVQAQMQYDFDKKEAATKAEQDKKDALTKAELQKQKVLKYSFIGGAILLLALALVLYNRYRLKQKSNKLLEEKNEVITQSYDELKKAQGQLVQSEKMASLGQLTAGIAHEINNPINFVSANVNPLKRNYDELVEFILKKKAINEEDLNYNIVESNELFSGIEEGATRTTEIVKGLRNFSRLDEDDFKDANINEGIDSTLMLLHNKLNERNIEVVRFPGEIPEIKCFPGQLNQVFMNVLSNAIDAIGENGKITISTSLENAHVKISITDTGKGMSQEVRQKIFEPFFTTKDVGKGTGLGLSISYGIIQEHKGKIEVQSQTGKGAEFIITLPVS